MDRWKYRVAVACALVACAGLARAQSYPSKPIRIVVAFAPSGIADTIARLVGEKASERLGQPVIIENRPGAGGVVASKMVAAAPADGYVLLAHTAAIAISATTVKDGFDPLTQLVPVALVAWTPTILAVNASGPALNLQEYLRAKGGRVTYSSAGIGTPPHLTAEYLLKSVPGVDAVHVPYQGGPQAITAVLAQQTDIVSTSMPPAVAHIKQGKLRALVVASAKRVATLPDVPTVAESGLPEYEDLSWVAFFAPARTSAAVVQRLNAEINEALKQPELRERLTAIGFETTASTPEEFAQYMKNEVAKWARVVRATGFTGN